MPEPRRSLVKRCLENFAGHGRLLNPAAAKVSCVSTHSPHAEYSKVIADIGQRWIRMIQYANAVDLKALLLQILGNMNGKVTPTCDQPNFLPIE